MARLPGSPSYPRDANGIPIPALTPLGDPLVLTADATADTGEIPDHRGVVQVANAVGIRFAFHPSATAADTNDPYLPAGVYTMKVPEGATHFSVIEAVVDTDGTVTVTALT